MFVVLRFESLTPERILPTIESKVCLVCLAYCQSSNCKVAVYGRTSTDPARFVQIRVTDKVEICSSEEEEDRQSMSLHSSMKSLPLEGLNEPFCVSSANHVVITLPNVLREIAKNTNSISLMGFRQTCFKACAETSFWTNFCQSGINQLTLSKEQLLSLLSTLERRLSDLVLKRKRKDRIVDGYSFFEGSRDPTLVDILLFTYLKSVQAPVLDFIPQFMPLRDWYLRTEAYFMNHNISNTLLSMNCVPSHSVVCDYESTIPVELADNKKLTHVNDVIAKVNNLEVNYYDSADDDDDDDDDQFRIDWQNIPIEATPIEGFPGKRIDRKLEQIESMMRIIKKFVRNQERIVDFCSGAGHVGILIAYLFPNTRVFLLDNKAESLDRALRRIRRLNLSNIVVIQGNLTSILFHFDLAVALHACGSSTDLILKKCMEHRAHFVICPCCYGSITQEKGRCEYPRSEFFRQLGLDTEEWESLANCADGCKRKSIERHPTLSVDRCMYYIDLDRTKWSEENGYHSRIGKLKPPECSKKNNILIGIYGASELTL